MSEYTKLPADLPEDWAPSQVVTPQGVEAGLPERYGYNYLMKQVNEAQRMCNRLLEDNGKLRTELANKANVGPPQEYGLELAAGLSRIHQNSYSKNAFGYVVVLISCKKETGYIEHNDLIATLPEGFAPRQLLEVNGSADASGKKEGCTFYVYTDGRITACLTDLSKVNTCYLSSTFLTTQ